MAHPESPSPISFPAIPGSGSGAGSGGAGSAGDGAYGTAGVSPSTRALRGSASHQLLQMRESLSRRAAPPVVNGVTPYLDVMTISSAQFPTTIDGGKNQEEHTRLLMEPIAVPNLDHTGLTANAQRQKQVPLFYPTGKKNCNFRDTIRGRVRTVARTGILTPDVAQQDALADSIRDTVKERLAGRPRKGASRLSGRSRSPPGAAARTRELTRMMRGEHAMTPGFGAALVRAEAQRGTTSSSRRRRRRGHSSSGGHRRRAGARPASVLSNATSRSAGSRRSRRSRGSPGSVASGRSAFSGRSRTSVYSSMSRARAIDAETRDLLRSLSETNEAMTRALTRA